MSDVKDEVKSDPEGTSDIGSPSLSVSTARATPVNFKSPFEALENAVKAEETPGESSSPPKLTPRGGGRGRKKGWGNRSRSPTFQPVIIDDLPTAWDEAHETFEALERCVYERKDMGLSRELDEMMVCDCVYDRDDPHADPCGSESDCINRAIFIECLADECRAGIHCRNQRFSKRQYSDVDVVQTEKKGFGLRASSNLPSGSLIYEYIGEVITEKTFRKRMAAYADEGIKHFYFMMLQKEEYIDATKKGGIGRFANHSCNPNSEVQKWVVGRRMRMGIFTKRDVVMGEEITFNYNVDRYGHEAQICYCGEPNCVGTIGGKTQTDIGGMNDLFLDALGITEEVEAMEMKGNKKKKARQLDDDYIPTLHPIQEHEVNKVAAAIRQSMENKRIMLRLLERVRMTEEPAIQRQLMRMHGFSLMTMILTDMASERDIVLLALESMAKWKLTIRNKIEDSNVEEPIKSLCKGDDSHLAELGKQLLDYWSTIELSYRIPRVSKIASLDAEDDRNTTTIAEANSMPYRRPARMDNLANNASIELELAPVRVRTQAPPARYRPPPPLPPPRPAQSTSVDRSKLNAIIALAQQTVNSVTIMPSESSPLSATAESSRSGSRAIDNVDKPPEARKRQRTSTRSAAEEEARKEKQLKKLVGEVVVQSMSKYKDQMEHETFKRYAKDCTSILVDKEKRGHSYASHRHPSLTDDKMAKIKAFTKDYAHKLLKRLKDKGKLRKPLVGADRKSSSSATQSKSVSTPSASLEQPNGSAMLLSEMFGEDDDDDDKSEGVDDQGMDIDERTSQQIMLANHKLVTPEKSPSQNDLSTIVNLEDSTHTATKPFFVERSTGPFLIERMSGPFLVDRIENVSVSIATPADTPTSDPPMSGPRQ